MMDRPVVNLFSVRLLPAVVVALLPLCCNHVSAQSRPPTTAAEVEALVGELSNWGRWGDDDQLGALNLITPEKRRQAAALVTEGVSISLARNVETEKAADNADPFDHTMLLAGRGTTGPWSLDRISVAYHGYAHTHLDSLCHLFYRGKMYNGF